MNFAHFEQVPKMSHPITYKYKINCTDIPTILCFYSSAKNKVKTERVQLTTTT